MIFFRGLIAALLGVATLSACQTESAAKSEVGLPTVPVRIASSTGTHRFKAEVARSSQEQARGLMFRASLAPDEAMIFPMDPPRRASFWMKNTPIPLDIIFIRADGTIESIAAETVPYSLDQVPSTEPVAAVLEIAGGRAAELGISEGDSVSWPR